MTQPTIHHKHTTRYGFQVGTLSGPNVSCGSLLNYTLQTKGLHAIYLNIYLLAVIMIYTVYITNYCQQEAQFTSLFHFGYIYKLFQISGNTSNCSMYRLPTLRRERLKLTAKWSVHELHVSIES